MRRRFAMREEVVAIRGQQVRIGLEGAGIEGEARPGCAEHRRSQARIDVLPFEPEVSEELPVRVLAPNVRARVAGERAADDPSVAHCPCVVLNGYSMGFTPCDERAQNGTSLFSTFSAANVNSEFGILSCPADAAWVNCLDYPCELDPRDPALATCRCAVVEQGPFRTFGGYCDERVCTTELLSGTSLNAPGVAQYLAGMQQVRQAVTLPETCPSPAESATPGATPAAG